MSKNWAHDLQYRSGICPKRVTQAVYHSKRRQKEASAMGIETVQQQQQEHLMRMPNVVGVGIGEKVGKKVIKVLVTHKVPVSSLKPEDVVPRRIGGYETDVEEIG